MNLSDEADLIKKFFDEELDETEVKSFKEKVATDPAFAREVRRQAEMNVALEMIMEAAEKKRRRSKVVSLVFRAIHRPLPYAAAAAILLFTIGALWWLFKLKAPDSAHIAALKLQNEKQNAVIDSMERQQVFFQNKVDSFQQIIAEQSHAQDTARKTIAQLNRQIENTQLAYLPHPDFEKEIAENIRSGESDIRSPQRNSIFNWSETVVFEWAENWEITMFKLFDHTGKTLKKIGKPSNPYSMNTKDLPPGLFYWQIEEAMKTLHIGRFYVVKQSESLKQ